GPYLAGAGRRIPPFPSHNLKDHPVISTTTLRTVMLRRRRRRERSMQAGFDSEWRRRALDGDADAVRQLANATLAPLYHFCLYRVGKDVHKCEEVVQETLARALHQLEQYDPARCNDNIF